MAFAPAGARDLRLKWGRRILPAMRFGSGSGLRVWGLVLAVCGCGDDPVQSTFDDAGSVCLSLQADGTIKATVQFRTCLTSCDTARDAWCSLQIDSQKLVVKSHAASEREGDSSRCAGNCVPFSAKCVTAEKAAPGSYSVVHGADSGNVLLGSQQTCLF